MKIVFTGGGTTGHVTKNIIVMEALKKIYPELEFHYLGSKQGKEVDLVGKDLATFHAISSGKLRRYFALETIPDFFRFLAGIWQSFWLLGKLKPRLVFSSGGFVALPTAIGAWLRKVPIITHETDSYPGLANRMMGRMATKILLGYESAKPYFNASKAVFTGNPVSPKLFEGSRERALAKLGFDPHRKTILVMGGSQGAQQINELIWAILPELVEGRNGETLSSTDNPDYRISASKSSAIPSATAPLRTASLATAWQVIHLTGKGKKAENTSSYATFEYVTGDYPDFLMAGDLVISRAGGNSLAEIEALGKTAILIPLPLPAAAGDHQRKNAEEMLKKHSDWQVLTNPKSEELLESVRRVPPMAADPHVARGDAAQKVVAEVSPLLGL